MRGVFKRTYNRQKIIVVVVVATICLFRWGVENVVEIYHPPYPLYYFIIFI
jgi:hypothetical protein